MTTLACFSPFAFCCTASELELACTAAAAETANRPNFLPGDICEHLFPLDCSRDTTILRRPLAFLHSFNKRIFAVSLELFPSTTSSTHSDARFIYLFVDGHGAAVRLRLRCIPSALFSCAAFLRANNLCVIIPRCLQHG